MSLPDWARFVALHLRGDPSNPHRDVRLLKPETFARLHAPAPDPENHYAMGWATLERGWAHGRGLTHAGSDTRWFCVPWLAPERDLAVLLACNRGGDASARACDEAAAALIRRFLPQE